MLCSMRWRIRLEPSHRSSNRSSFLYFFFMFFFLRTYEYNMEEIEIKKIEK